jgi:hypothetical protein
VRAVADEQLYPVAPELTESSQWIKGALFLPGKTPAGEQWVLCEAGYQVFAHRFSADGVYLGRTARAVANWADILAWIGELRLTPATVHLRKFNSAFDDPTPDRVQGPNLVGAGGDPPAGRPGCPRG